MENCATKEELKELEISIIREIHDLKMDIEVMKVKSARFWGIFGSVAGSIISAIALEFIKHG